MATVNPTSNAFSDFQFIAHDVHPKQKRQIPTVVRAHVMERYHREKRAKNTTQDKSNISYSQPTMAALPPSRRGQIMRWDNDSKQKNPKAKLRQSKQVCIAPPLGFVQQVMRQNQSDLCNWVEQNADEISDGNDRTESDAVEAFKRRLADTLQKTFDRERQVRSLMPNNEMENGGMRLVRALDEYYGVLDVNQQNMDPWHEMWIPFAFSDPLLMHSCIAKFSLHAAAAAGGKLKDPNVIKHLQISITTMSQAVTQSCEQIPDSMLVAAICLCGIEMLGTNTAAVRAHLMGARKMIEIRGGLDALEMDPVLMSGYMAYEFIVATMDADFQVPLSLEQKAQLPSPFAIKFPAETGVFTLARKPVDPIAYGFSQESVNILALLCNEFCVSDVLIYKGQGCPSLREYVEIMYSKNRPTRHLHLSPQQRSKISDEDHVLQTLLIAISLQLPYLIPTNVQVGTITERLQSLQYHVRKSPVQRYWKPVPGAFIWCLMAAVPASHGLPERGAVIANLLRATIGCAFELLEPVRVALATFHKLAKEQKRRQRSIIEMAVSGIRSPASCKAGDTIPERQFVHQVF